MASSAEQSHMRQAIALMRQAGVVEGTGGPFGAVVVRDHDPTAHAEVNAIRQACRTLGSHDLTGTVLYASGECCPMCWAAERRTPAGPRPWPGEAARCWPQTCPAADGAPAAP